MDYKEKKVFILENGKYKEITYSEFRERMEANELSGNDNSSEDRPFSERFFISIDDTLLEVSKEQYIDYYKDKRRQKYCRCSDRLTQNSSMEMTQNSPRL